MGEQLGYAITDRRCAWLGVRVFCAASRRLRARDRWIGWTEEQRRRRLPLRVNNCRFLLLPHKTFPNLASQALGLSLDRLSSDWQARYDHPVVLVETFVDPEPFSGTVYTANGWQELEKTFLQIQEQIRGPAPADELIALDGKQPRQGGGHSVLTAVTIPSPHGLGH